LRPMFTAKELKDLRVGDEIDTGAFVFEGLPKSECVVLVVRHRKKNALVAFDVTYFGIKIGEWVAQVQATGDVLWIDQAKSRADRDAKGKSTGKKSMSARRTRRYH